MNKADQLVGSWDSVPPREATVRPGLPMEAGITELSPQRHVTSDKQSP